MNVGRLLRDGQSQRLDRTRSRMRNYREALTDWSAHRQVDLVDVTRRSMEAEASRSATCASPAQARTPL
jgi:hypothetical protein